MERVVAGFVARDGKVLILRRSELAIPYPKRLACAWGPLVPGEPVAAVGERLVTAATSLAPLAFVRAGLAVEVENLWPRPTGRRRIYPVLFASPAGEPVLDELHDDARWLEPEELVVPCATHQAIPDLDEALARVWDAPGALPGLFRDDARALAAFAGDVVEAALRGIGLVAAGAPVERVAALRPWDATFVNAVRASATPGRDVARELDEQRARARAAGARLNAAGAAVVEAMATLSGGDVIAPRAAVPGGDAPLTIVADAWTRWPDDVPPPLDERLVRIARARVAQWA